MLKIWKEFLVGLSDFQTKDTSDEVLETSNKKNIFENIFGWCKWKYKGKNCGTDDFQTKDTSDEVLKTSNKKRCLELFLVDVS